MKMFKWIGTYISVLRVFIAWICFCTNKHKNKCEMDLAAWIQHYGMKNKGKFWQLGYLLINEKETRNIFLNRLHRNPLEFIIVRVLFPPLSTLYINMPPEQIGGGLVFQHGFSTIIAAKRIGNNCKIFQQVTIGYNEDKCPIIDDDVTICAGAIVIGDVHIESGAVVGAGAVVTSNVLSNTTVVGVPAKKISYKENEK